MILTQKTNNDWWSIRQSNGTEGYVPANYVKEVEPKVVQKKVKRPVKIPEKVMVKKVGYKKEKQKKKKPPKLRRTPSGSFLYSSTMKFLCLLCSCQSSGWLFPYLA